MRELIKKIISNLNSKTISGNNSLDSGIFHQSKEDNHRKLDFTLLYTGTVDTNSCLDIVIETMPNLILKIPNLNLSIIPEFENDQKYLQLLKRKIIDYKLSNYVTIESPMPLEDEVEKIRNADIGIVLTKKDAYTELLLSEKLLEFIIVEIPVIATRTRRLTQSFDSSQIYFLNENTPETLEKAVLTLFRDDKLRNTLSQNGKKYFQRHSWVAEEEKYQDMIDSLSVTKE